jgi:hypothetical protein
LGCNVFIKRAVPHLARMLAHKCKAHDDGYFFVGMCQVCWTKPATVALLHQDRKTAHACRCEDCYQVQVDNNGQPKICDCGAPLCTGDNIALESTEPPCANNCCVYLGTCTSCFTEGKRTTTCVYGITSENEEKISNRAFEFVSCIKHKPKNNAKVVFGTLFSLGAETDLGSEQVDKPRPKPAQREKKKGRAKKTRAFTEEQRRGHLKPPDVIFPIR